ncbi:molybdopterin molybdotransferase MoeA [Desulfosporosinus sp. PR]|uniref:molybdopterin molybdotransferase MoeA n=1 Tax=Candidatus Desulfosporosinus nitrosoreducens TaxID=3401928 RepID=UPI0027F65948|nr:molybdopterin molybdotransferase MoeA [Desulfosporosinus sp. PR]MDQ7096467.1 molybdopterin molybdotransferase MoeA [Desulfosporosinus sp. PR]
MEKSVIIPPKPCTEVCNDCSCHCVKKIVPVPTVDEALGLWLEKMPLREEKAEHIPLAQGLGRVLAEDVCAKVGVPVATCATHDGIAIHFEKSKAAFERGTRILQPGDFHHCPMGAAIPEQFDSIVHAEQCKINSDGTATLLELPVQYQSVKIKGTYVGQGEQLAGAGEKLSPSHLALMQYTGHTTVSVKRQPKISIIPIGDDLVPPGTVPLAGQYIECDSVYIQSIAAQCGAQSTVFPIVADRGEAIEASIQKALPGCDILVVIGGVGKGEVNYEDYTLGVVRKMGQIACHGVQLSPGGKNMLLAQIDGKPLLGIPGPPHAAIIMTEYFLPPVIEWYMGCLLYERPVIQAVLEQDFPARGGGTSIWEPRVHVRETPGGYTARLVGYMGETVENFIGANASVSVTGDRDQYRKGKSIKAKLLVNERTITSNT